MSYTPTNWTTGDTITASALNKIENGIANAGGGKYDAYDFVISQVDSGTPVLEKGTWQDIYDALQNMEHVVGLYVWNATPNEFHNTESICLPLTYNYYYDSMDVIIGMASYYAGGARAIEVDWNSPDTIVVTKINP